MKIFILSLFLFSIHTVYADPPATHGMAVFGKQATYLSHLPMFHSPHDYQAIFTAAFDSEGQRDYLNPANNPTGTFYTLAPQILVLPDLVAQAEQTGVSKRTQLFTGVFDEGGTPISPVFTTQFTGVVYFKPFEANAVKPAHPIYILFGDPSSEIYLAHVIHAPPDFDQILKVQSLGARLAQLLKARGTLYVMFTDISGDVPLPGQGLLSALTDISAQTSMHENLEIEKQVYFNSNDLAQ